MPASTRLIRRRIKSVGNTKKITKAMEMVSASKMRKAVNSVLGTRPYSDLAWKMVGEIGRTVDVSLHPLLRKSEKVQNILIVVVASDRGLAGSYNAQVGRALTEALGKLNSSLRVPILSGRGNLSEIKTDFITVGKKAEGFVRKIFGNIVATFTNMGNNPTSLDIRPLAGLLTGEFISGKPPHPSSGHEPESEVNIGCGGKYDRVYVLYTDFKSALRQIPRIKQLLPVEKDVELGSADQEKVTSYELPVTSYEYLFEPSPKQVLDLMLPRIVETQVFQSILESNASEHSARMMAMKNATDAAGDMIDDLTFTFNQIRQATITRELAEIVSGKAAIE